MVPDQQKEQVFESSENKDEEIVAEPPVNIELNFNSISSFVRKFPSAPAKMWARAQRHNQKEYLQSEEDIQNFLHEFLKKWWEYCNPFDRVSVTKTQTENAVKELKKAVLSNQPEDDAKGAEDLGLSKESWRQFIEQMKRDGENNDAPKVTSFMSFGGKVFAPVYEAPEVKKGLEVVYESVEDRSKETPIQKYRRLKAEVAEFADSLKDLPDKKSAPDECTTAEISNDLSKMSALLAKPFGNLLCETEGETRKNSEILYNGLCSHLAKAKADEDVKPAVFSLVANKPGEYGTYRLQKIDDRLKKLEGIISKGQPIDINKSNDVMSSIDYLTSQLNELSEAGKSKTLEKKVKSLNGQLQQIEETLTKKGSSVGVTKNETKLIEKMPVWDKAATQLPIVLDRLKSLKLLNKEAAGVEEQVIKIRDQQELLSTSLEEDKKLLHEVFETLSSNVEEIYASVQRVDERIASLTNV